MSLVAASNRQATLHKKSLNDRPMTAGDSSIQSYSRLRGRQEYLKFKYEGENSKIVLGTDGVRGGVSRAGGVGSRLGSPALGATDYRQNFTWTVPKYAL